MQKFQFRLATVLKWRTLELELEETRLEALFGERKRIENEFARLDQDRAGADRVLARDAIEGQELVALDLYRHSLQRAGDRLRAAGANCEQRIGAQRQRVLEAERRVQLLEKLKERRLAEWQLAAAVELDTLASETFLAKCVRESRH